MALWSQVELYHPGWKDVLVWCQSSPELWGGLGVGAVAGDAAAAVVLVIRGAREHSAHLEGGSEEVLEEWEWNIHGTSMRKCPRGTCSAALCGIKDWGGSHNVGGVHILGPNDHSELSPSSCTP